MILGRGHDSAVDWWGLGILIYEMIARVPPFMARPERICAKILNNRPTFSYIFSVEAKDIITQLLAKNPIDRLGNIDGGAERIKKHPWFRKIDWEQLIQQKLPAPYVPSLKSADDLTNFVMTLEPDPSQPVPITNCGWDEEF